MTDPGISLSTPPEVFLGLFALIAVVVICRTIQKLKGRDHD